MLKTVMKFRNKAIPRDNICPLVNIYNQKKNNLAIFEGKNIHVRGTNQNVYGIKKHPFQTFQELEHICFVVGEVTMYILQSIVMP